MCRSVPRYWMVAAACFVMVTTLSVEYVRLVYHPTDRADVHAHLHIATLVERKQRNTSQFVLRTSDESEIEQSNTSQFLLRTNDESELLRSLKSTLEHYTTVPTNSNHHFRQDVRVITPPPQPSKYEVESKSLISEQQMDFDSKVKGKSSLILALPHSTGISNREQEKHIQVYNQGGHNRQHNKVQKQRHKPLPTNGHVKKQHKTDSQATNKPSILQPVGSENHHRKMQSYHARNKVVGISRGLLNLLGVNLSISPLHERGFPVWHNMTEVARHFSNVHEVVRQTGSEGTIHENITARSLNADIIARGHFQQKQVERFCHQSSHGFSHLPSTPEALSTLFSHLLYDDSKKIVFCYVPKNGCSNMKRLLLILNEILPPESAQESRPSEAVLKTANSFRNLTAEQALHKLQNYYKFAIVRNPLERLLSAYRNKLEHPVLYADRKHFPSSLQLFIMSLFRPKQVHSWLESPAEERRISRRILFPSFREFVTYMTLFPLGDYNEHFSPFSEMCDPCAIHYDFYANFKTMDYDLEEVLNYLSIPTSYYPSDTPKHKTEKFMNEYYKLVPWKEKKALFDAFQNELDLYYSLYPEESNSHKQLLELY